MKTLLPRRPRPSSSSNPANRSSASSTTTIAEKEIADPARAEPRQREEAADDGRQARAFLNFDQTQLAKPPARAEFDPLGFRLQEGMKVDDVGVFWVDTEAIVDGLDERAKLGRSRRSRQQTERRVLTLGERTGPGEPIEALLKRRRIRSWRASRADRGGAPCLPTRQMHRRFDGRPSSCRARSRAEFRQAEHACVALDPSDDVSIDARRLGEMARPQGVGEIAAKNPAFVGMHGLVLSVSMPGQGTCAPHSRLTKRLCPRVSPSM
jgi:hypothetical protein